MKELEMLLRQRWILKADQKEQYYRCLLYTSQRFIEVN